MLHCFLMEMLSCRDVPRHVIRIVLAAYESVSCFYAIEVLLQNCGETVLTLSFIYCDQFSFIYCDQVSFIYCNHLLYRSSSRFHVLPEPSQWHRRNQTIQSAVQLEAAITLQVQSPTRWLNFQCWHNRKDDENIMCWQDYFYYQQKSFVMTAANFQVM